MQDIMTDLSVRVGENKMAIGSRYMFDFFTILSVLTIMCWDFSTPVAESSVQIAAPRVFATAMCTNTYDSTTYTKRMDVNTACTNTVETCIEDSEKSCPKGLVPLNTWISHD